MLDVSGFEGELLEYAERERTDEVFEAIGFRVAGCAPLRHSRRFCSASRGCS
jgi:hypothetical protein